MQKKKNNNTSSSPSHLYKNLRTQIIFAPVDTEIFLSFLIRHKSILLYFDLFNEA